MLALVVAAGLAVAAQGEETRPWVCTASSGTGFRFDGQRWAPATFNVSDQRYLLARKVAEFGTRKGETIYHLTQVGETIAAPCRDTGVDGELECFATFGDFSAS